MFDKQRRINAAFEKMVVKESAADRAIKFAANRQKRAIYRHSQLPLLQR